MIKTYPYQGKSILAVLAHPDDESFGMGGTLALYASRGAAVHLVCATRGEAGEVEPDLLEGYDSLASLRDKELRCAAGVLGLRSVQFLGYRDSGMSGSQENHHPQALASQPLEKVAEKIVHIMREIKPQVVLTFDPLGGYQHPDHIAIHKAAVHAFEQSGKTVYHPDDLPAYAPERLFFHIMPKAMIKIGIRVIKLMGRDPRNFGSNNDIDLLQIAKADFPIHARININAVRQIKEQAGACHASQGGGRFGGGLLGMVMRLSNRHETFMRAYPPVKKGERIAYDLFEKL
jgi:N-acetyl-1-D-myo-inositol-2-amino-2-deoxy-alpha-D-glucopyranoside deacetylase